MNWWRYFTGHGSGWCRLFRRQYTDNHDSRTNLVTRTLNSRTARIARIEPDEKQAVYLFFSGVLNYLAGQFPYVCHSTSRDLFRENNRATLIISLADEHPDIKGFFMMDINEPLQALHSSIQYPADAR